MNCETTKILLNILAIFCVAAVWTSFKYGYSKAERDRLKEQKRIWDREQERLPKALGKVKTFKRSS